MELCVGRLSLPDFYRNIEGSTHDKIDISRRIHEVGTICRTAKLFEWRITDFIDYQEKFHKTTLTMFTHFLLGVWRSRRVRCVGNECHFFPFIYRGCSRHTSYSYRLFLHPRIGWGVYNVSGHSDNLTKATFLKSVLFSVASYFVQTFVLR